MSDTGGHQTITGPAAGVTVSGNQASRVFQVDGLVTASISGLTITGGTTTGNGGGLANFGTTTLSNCTVSGNSATGSYSDGGGLANYGALTLTNCTVSGNSATGSYSDGGGLYNGGTLTMTNCTVSGNSASIGSGVTNGSLFFNRGATLTLSNCTVSGNSATGNGGGLANYGCADADQLHRQRQLRQ